MGVHIKPSDVFDEMNALVDAYEDASSVFGTKVREKWPRAIQRNH